MPTPATTIEVDGYEIRVSNPDKVLFPEIGVTKMELVEYYLTVADAALIGCRDRPTIMHRFPNGVDGEPFYQKRVPSQRPPWVQTATITFPSGRHAVMVAPADAAHLAWMANLACLDLNPWPVRRDDVDHPDELRVDLDPTPGVPWGDVRDVTMFVREVLEEHGAVGFPATSGKRGMHLVVPIVREHGFTNVRRAALALAREVTRRAPGVATAAWWKEERQGVFVDYNQNARDRTVASVYSVRPVPDARVAMPLSWDEVPDVDPSVFTIRRSRIASRRSAIRGRVRTRSSGRASMDCWSSPRRTRQEVWETRRGRPLPEGRQRARTGESVARAKGRRVGGLRRKKP